MDAKRIFSVSFFTALVGLFVVFATPQNLSAQNPLTPLSGWAWSDNIGWLSFSSTNANSDGGDYGVYLNPATTGADAGLLSGYAWANPNDDGFVSNSGGTKGKVSFETPGSYTWTVPVGITSIKIKMTGAGGKGGDGNSSWVNGGSGPGGGGGGGSGAYGERFVVVSPGQTYQMTIGNSGEVTSISGAGVNLSIGSGGNGGVGSSGVGGSAGTAGAQGSSFDVSYLGAIGSTGVPGGYSFSCGNGFSTGGDGGKGGDSRYGGIGGAGGIDPCRQTTPAGDGGVGAVGAGGGGASGWISGDYAGTNNGGFGGSGGVTIIYPSDFIADQVLFGANSGGNGSVGSAGVGGAGGLGGTTVGTFEVSQNGSNGSAGVAGGYSFSCNGAGFSTGGDGGVGAASVKGVAGGIGGHDPCRTSSLAGNGGAGGLGAGGGGATGWYGSAGVGGNGKVEIISGGSTLSNFSTAGTYTWTVPSGIILVTIKMTGAGGNGGTSNNGWVNGGSGPGGGGGGGAGAYGEKTLSVSPGQVYQVVVGSPGVTTTFELVGETNPSQYLPSLTDNIGWISFNTSDLVGCPSGVCEARITGGALNGWARVCSVFVSACSGTLKPSTERGGWDGWISLSGTWTNPTTSATGSYGPVVSTVPADNGLLKGWAWGSDVVGWISFNPFDSVGDGGGCVTSPCGGSPPTTGVTIGSPSNPATRSVTLKVSQRNNDSTGWLPSQVTTTSSPAGTVNGKLVRLVYTLVGFGPNTECEPFGTNMASVNLNDDWFNDGFVVSGDTSTTYDFTVRCIDLDVQSASKDSNLFALAFDAVKQLASAFLAQTPSCFDTGAACGDAYIQVLTPPAGTLQVSCNASVSNVRLNRVVTFSATTPAPSPTYSWTISGGDPSLSTQSSVSVKYSTAGQKTATVQVTSGTESKICETKVRVLSPTQGEN